MSSILFSSCSTFFKNLKHKRVSNSKKNPPSGRGEGIIYIGTLGLRIGEGGGIFGKRSGQNWDSTLIPNFESPFTEIERTDFLQIQISFQKGEGEIDARDGLHCPWGETCLDLKAQSTMHALLDWKFVHNESDGITKRQRIAECCCIAHKKWHFRLFSV